MVIIMQNIYKKENISLNYLNNYTKFSLRGNILHFYNTIYDKKVTLEGKNECLKEFLQNIIQGVDDKSLLNILNKISDKPTLLYECLLQNFIIE